MKQDPAQGRHWYVLHTYSWYEDTVANDLLQRIESMSMQEYIFDVLVPKETEYVIKKGETVENKKKIFPWYVLIDMIVTDKSWYVVRNTPNVTWFIGSWNIPVPVTPEEFGIIKDKTQSDKPTFKSNFEKGDEVQIIFGPFTGHKGYIDVVNKEKWTIKVLVNVFERETPVELKFDEVKKEV